MSIDMDSKTAQTIDPGIPLPKKNATGRKTFAETDSRLALFLQLERALRAAKDLQTLSFVICNGTYSLVHYDVAVLLSTGPTRARVTTVSGVSDFDRQAPLVLMAESLINTAIERFVGVGVHESKGLQKNIGKTLSGMGFTSCLSIALPGTEAVLLMMRKTSWPAKERQILLQFSEVAGHAMAALECREPQTMFSSLTAKSKYSANRVAAQLPFLSRLKHLFVVTLLLGLAYFPVSQSIIAPAEVAAGNSRVIGAGLNGVIRKVWVKPNDSVKRGERLLSFEATELMSQQQRLQKELALAVEKLRKARQSTLNSGNSAALLIEFETRIALKKLELEFTQKQIERLEIVSPGDGIVRFSRVSDWEGRSVATGEKIMEIADSDGKLFEVMVAVDDAINLPDGSVVKFFPDAYPLQSMVGRVASMSFFAVKVDEAAMAYRVIAKPENEDGQGADTIRLGMKGSARLYGEEVPLAYYLFRKPIGAIRRYVGI